MKLYWDNRFWHGSESAVFLLVMVDPRFLAHFIAIVSLT